MSSIKARSLLNAISGRIYTPSVVDVRAKRSITIGKPLEEVYRFFRDLENLPRFVSRLQAVRPMEGGLVHWVARGGFGGTFEGDAELTLDLPNERIAWRSVAPHDVRCAAAVDFAPAPGGRGTEVTVSLDFDPPWGLFGRLAGRLWGEALDQAVRGDLRRCKQLLEAHEIPTAEGQPSCLRCE